MAKLDKLLKESLADSLIHRETSAAMWETPKTKSKQKEKKRCAGRVCLFKKNRNKNHNISNLTGLS